LAPGSRNRFAQGGAFSHGREWEAAPLERAKNGRGHRKSYVPRFFEPEFSALAQPCGQGNLRGLPRAHRRRSAPSLGHVGVTTIAARICLSIAMLWFNPRYGGSELRLIMNAERACDEASSKRRRPQSMRKILKICEFGVDSHSVVSESPRRLKQRITDHVRNSARKLDLGRKLLIARPLFLGPSCSPRRGCCPRARSAFLPAPSFANRKHRGWYSSVSISPVKSGGNRRADVRTQ